MYKYLIFQLLGVILIVAALAVVLTKAGFWSWLIGKIKQTNKLTWVCLFVFLVGVELIFFGNQKYAIHFAMPPNMHSATPDNNPPSLPIINALRFLKDSGRFDRVKDIGADPNKVPPRIERTTSATVKLSMTAKEVIAEVAPGIENNYWTYDGQVPGPMLRVREGDTVELSLTNDKRSLHDHNIDLHAVTGPGGGASVQKVAPGKTKTFTWKALQPGLFIYHCASSNVSVHNSHGQYGLIYVQPKENLPKVDKEFYIVQGELYTSGGIGKKGLQVFDAQLLLDNNPTYVTFNGKIDKTPRMKVKKGQTVRIYVGNGGVSLISSFHIIGEIFDNVYLEGGMGRGSAMGHNIQTTTVLPGGSSIVEFKVDVPGRYMLVDHALARMNKGAWAYLDVEGDPSPEIFRGGSLDEHAGHTQ